MDSNVVLAADRFKSPPISASNENSKLYTKFCVCNLYTETLLIISDDEIVAAADYHPVNIVEFIEMYNHGKFDAMEEPHLVIIQPYESRIIMGVVIAPSVQ